MKTNSAEILSNTKDPFILDVRTPIEYHTVHVDGAKLLPLDQLDPTRFSEWAKQHGWKANEPIYILCKSGKRAQAAATKLAGLNLDLCVIDGGTEACIAQGLPLQRPAKSTISLERQVRIVAGALVITGLILAWLFSPIFLLISGLVGAGLMISGITNTCAMGMLLARMPWNRHTPHTCHK